MKVCDTILTERGRKPQTKGRSRTMTRKEEQRAEILKYLQSQNAKWHATEGLQETIAKVMGYEVIHMTLGGCLYIPLAQREKVDTIIIRMAEQGFIQLSKNAGTYKVLKTK